MSLTHLSLFTGIGGIDLAAEWAGFESIGQVEFADYPYKVLCKRWPDVPKWRDVRDVTSGSIWEKYKGHITLISGGFPCQPFSVAGKRRGKEDPRFLWQEMLRLVQELKPTWIIGENVAGIITMELDNCITDLEDQGYSTRAFLIPACAIGACHKRDRIFIVANSNSSTDRTIRKKIPEKNRVQGINRKALCSGMPIRTDTNASNNISKRRSPGTISETDRYDPDSIRTESKILQRENTHSNSTGLQRINQIPYREWEPKESLGLRDGMSWYEAATKFCRVDDGISHRMDRLKCLGNSVVPQQVYPILKAISDIENGVICQT